MLFDAKNARNVNNGSIRGHDRRVVHREDRVLVQAGRHVPKRADVRVPAPGGAMNLP